MLSPEQERLSALETRLTRIEAVLGLSTGSSEDLPVSPAAPPKPAEPPPLPEILPPPLPQSPLASLPPPVPEHMSAPGSEPEPAREREPSMETRFGLGWLNRVAVVTLLFGVGFFFKYVVDNQWIGPGMR